MVKAQVKVKFGDVVEAKFGERWYRGQVGGIRRNGQPVVRYDDGVPVQHTTDRGLRLLHRPSMRRTRGVRISRRAKDIPASSGVARPLGRAAPEGARYNAAQKASSANKRQCRALMVAHLPPRNAKRRALALDAEDMLFSALLRERGFDADRVDVPNFGPARTIRRMKARRVASVHACAMGAFLRAQPEGSVQYDVAYLDYCGMPGDVGAPKEDTPIHDVRTLFARGLVAGKARIGVTVCMRSGGNKIKYQNMHAMSNAVVHAAFEHGYVAQAVEQLTYHDTSTMGFVCWDVRRIA